MVVLIIGILSAMALPQFNRVREKAQIARAIGDVDAIGWDVVEYELANGEFPNSLSEVGWGGKEDPWGNPIVYLRIKGGTGDKGAMRKDRFLVPINVGLRSLFHGAGWGYRHAFNRKPQSR